MRKKLTFNQLIISLFIGIYSLIEIIWFIKREKLIRFIFMTWWNLYLNSFYLTGILIFDILFYLKVLKLERINYFFREYLHPIFCTLTILVTIIFWGLIMPMLFLKGSKLENKLSDLGIYANIYRHFIITIFQIIDLFFAEKENITFNYNHWLGISFIIFCYSIVCFISFFKFNIVIYPFLENLNYIKIILLFSGFIIFYTSLYYFYIYLIKLKYKWKFYINEDAKYK